MKQTIKVENMTCQGCANNVKNKFSSIEQIHDVSIDLNKKEAILEVPEKVSTDELNETLKDTPYVVLSE